jgi:hypothetical protein
VSIKFEIKKTFTVNGQAWKNAPSTIRINGKTYASWDDVPAPYRLLVRGITAIALRNAEPQALRAEPVISMKKVVVALGLAVLGYWIARKFF